MVLKELPVMAMLFLLFSLAVVSDFVTPWTGACQASLSFTIPQNLPKFMSIELVIPSSHLIIWCPLLLLPLIFASIRDFSNESAVPIQLPKYWSLNFNICPFNDYSGFISLKIDWFALFTVQGTLRHLLQHHLNSLALCLLKGQPGVLQFMESQSWTRLSDYHSLTHWRWPIIKMLSIIS